MYRGLCECCRMEWKSVMSPYVCPYCDSHKVKNITAPAITRLKYPPPIRRKKSDGVAKEKVERD